MPAQLQTKVYFPSAGLNSDVNSLFVKDNEFTGVNNLRVKPNQLYTRNGCRKYGNAPSGTPGNVLHFHAYKVPNGKEYYFSFTKDNVYKYDLTTNTWVSVKNSGVTIADITYWSTTDLIDDTLGATVIAAGSIPVNDVSAEADATKRVLLYFDPTASEFKTLTLGENLDIVDEDPNLTIQPTSAIGVQTFGGGASSLFDKIEPAGSPARTLYPGTFVLSTDELGTLAYTDATAVTIGGKTCYHFVPVDQTRIKAGDGSYVSADGTIMKVEWLTTDFAGLKVKVSYTYQEATGMKPRYVKNYYNRLLMASTMEYDGSTAVYYPWRVRWGEIGKRALYKNSSYQDLIDVDVSAIMDWEEHGFYLTIIKRNCLYKVSHVGGDVVFLFQAAWKHGSPSRKTLKTFNDTQYFLGEDDVYRWDGSNLTSITLDRETGNHRVKNAILDKINFSNSASVFASLDLVNKEYWLWIPGSSEMTVYVYSISYDTWTIFTYPQLVYTANLGRAEEALTGKWKVVTGGTLVETLGTWANNTSKFERALETLDKLQFFGCASGNVYISDEKLSLDFATATAGVYTGTAISSYLITKDFIFNDVYRMDRTQRVELEIAGSSCTVGWDGEFSQDINAFKNTSTITLTPTWERRYYYPDCVTYQVRFCLQSSTYIGLRLMCIYGLDSRLSNR